MATMEALLKIRADVQGEGQVNALGRAIGGLSNTARRVQGGLRGLAGAAGGLSGALGALVPVVSVGGLAALAKNAIDAADDMNDLSQKTGVSVEQLSKFQQAANASGTSIEGVGAAMIKLNKGLAAGGGPAAEALQALGLSATDASGKLKTTDQVMLEIADKFAKMPDGAQKTALAMQLFGKAGADMIPLLNGGRKSIEGLAATMSGDFAKGADSLNDKLATLQGKLLQMGVAVGTALMPALNVIADLILKLAEGFAALPGPIQAIVGGVVALAAAFVILAPAISAIISIAGALAGLQLGATIAGWLGAVGPMVAGITAALGGLLAWITGTLIPGLLAVFTGPVGWTILAVAAVVAMCIYFREPIGQFLVWLGTEFMKALEALGQLAYNIFVQPWVSLWNNVLRGPVTTMLTWIGQYLQFSMATAYALAYQVFVQPWINLWNNVLRGPVTAMGQWLNGVWINISKAFNDYVTTPISNAWKTLVEFLPKTLESLAKAVKGAFQGVLQFIADRINSVGGLINNLISAFNRLPGPDIPMVPTLSVPAFAEGGVVTSPTLAMVGEGGEPEYIIPQSKMAASSANYLAGARGAGIMNGSGGATSINITTGPVLEFNGERYVTLADMERGLQQMAGSVMNGLRTPAGRYAVGVR